MPGKSSQMIENSNASIDQIREIIFGDQIMKLENKITELKKEISSLKNRVTTLEQKSSDFDKVLADSIEKQNATASDQQTTHDVIEQLKKEFDRKIAEINNAKVDKSQIGQAFIEWGMKVKQTANKEG